LHCEALKSGKTVSEEYTASIFMAELRKFGEVAGHVEVGDRKLVMDDRSIWLTLD
jgi:hypothetical protein